MFFLLSVPLNEQSENSRASYFRIQSVEPSLVTTYAAFSKPYQGDWFLMCLRVLAAEQ